MGSTRISAILARTPVPSPSASSLFNELESPDDEEPLLPDICLQILWTEDTKKSSSSAAVKAFVAVDWLGKSCVCWLLDEEKLLRCIDLKVTVHKYSFLQGLKFVLTQSFFTGEQSYRQFTLYMLRSMDNTSQRCRIYPIAQGSSRSRLCFVGRKQSHALFGQH